jgi:5-methyltetrahydrofolate--homocysteine methyltransferase
LGVERLADYPLERLIPYIDWSPFFQAWELSGPYPKILDDAIVGEQARRLLDEARQMLDRIVREKWIRAAGVCGIFPAAQVHGDDVEIYADESRSATRMTPLRQQNHKPAGRPNLCLADFVAPKAPARWTMQVRSPSAPAIRPACGRSRLRTTTTPQSC